MALPTGVQGVAAPVRLDGLLLAKTDVRTPLFNMLGGVATGARKFLVGAEFEIGSASQPAISEDASQTAPTPSYDQPTQASNVTQIFMKSVAETYRSESDTQTLTGLNLAGASANVQNKLAFAVANRTAEVRNDIEYTILNGVYADSNGNSAVADKTRGLNAAITTNAIAANGAELGWDILVSMAKSLVSLSPYGLMGVVGVLNGEQVVQLQKLVTEQGIKISPSAAGSNLYTIQTPFGVLNFLEGGHRYQPNGTAGFYRMGSCRNVFEPVPGKGNFFWEPLAKTGAADKSQLYGQWGLDHGHEWLHGKITGLSTTTTATTAPKMFVTNTASAPVYTDEVS
jgi:hypothetical protein